MMEDLATISRYLVGLLSRLAEDLDYSGNIRDDTRLFADLGFESLDLVILGTSIQEHYERPMAFSELMADLGERRVSDLTVADLTHFVHGELTKR